MDKPLYIVISQTGTILSRLLKLITGAEYNHSSISLTPSLDQMYSFGRRHPYNPFWGGFVQESPHFGTFKRFPRTKIIVVKVTVNEKDHQIIQQRMEQMLKQKHNYRYNYLGLCLAAFHIHYKSEGRFYCSEFVKDVLLPCDIKGVNALSPIVKPIHFLNLPYPQIYKGKLTDYVSP